MAAATTTSRTWADSRAKPTQSRPKNTLSGSTMEIQTERDRRQIQKLDINEYQRRIEEQRRLIQDRYKVPKVPQYMRKQFKVKSKDEIMKQLDQTNQARTLMDVLEEKSRYFEVGLNVDAKPPTTSRERSGQWMSSRDLRHSEDINSVGINQSNGYDRQKYDTKAPTHRYTLAGDPLRLGKGSSAPQTLDTHRRPYWLVERAPHPDRLPPEAFMKEDAEDSNDLCAVKLPPNIKHQFGTRVCNRLLSDVNKVEDAMVVQRKRNQHQNKHRRSSVLPRGEVDDHMNPAYKGLGDALRYDIFPGYSQNHKQSLAKSVYTEEVHRQRHPVPEQYRYKRDQLSTWAEHNVLRDRMKKAWEEFVLEKAPQK